MANITIRGLDSDMREIAKELRLTIRELADEVFEQAKDNTPIRSGNARSKWTKKVTEDNFTVANRVPYIERLEAGASKQAPKGIIGPTLTSVKGKVK